MEMCFLRTPESVVSRPALVGELDRLSGPRDPPGAGSGPVAYARCSRQASGSPCQADPRSCLCFVHPSLLNTLRSSQTPAPAFFLPGKLLIIWFYERDGGAVRERGSERMKEVWALVEKSGSRQKPGGSA